MLAYARGRFAEAAAAFEDAERLAEELRAPHFLARRAAMWARRARIADGAEPRGGAEGATHSDADLCAIAAREALALGDPDAAAAAVAPVLDGRAISFHPNVEVEALLLDAVARRALGDGDAAERDVERALALTEPQGRTWSVLTVPGVADVLRDHPRHRTKHGAHLRALLDAARGAEPATAPAEQLSEREVAVLRLLPTNLSANDIAKELFLSVHTVKTHMRRLYAKLDVHTRAEAVEKGRALGLLARR
jgi:LuxR family maltose regulon positive regulatory protein